VHPHTLRSAFVTMSLDAGVPLRDVQDAAGHVNPGTTRRYDRSRNNLSRSPGWGSPNPVPAQTPGPIGSGVSGCLRALQHVSSYLEVREISPGTRGWLPQGVFPLGNVSLWRSRDVGRGCQRPQ
jgi:hypothetical protein